MTSARKVLLGMLLGLTALTAVASVGLSAPAVPHDLRGAILLRAVAYERGFASRAGPVVLAVLGESSGESAEDADAMMKVFSKLVEKTTIASRPASVVRVMVESKAKLQEALRANKAELVYVPRGMSAVIADIPLQEASWVRIVVCGDGDDAKRGCALAVSRSDNKPELLVNVKLANDIGLRFSPELLRLARIVN